MPTYEPERWNTPKELRAANNCYNYATNNRYDPANPGEMKSRPEPGRKGGKRIKRFVRRLNLSMDGEPPKPFSLYQLACKTADHAGEPNDPDPAGQTDADVRAEYQRPLVGVCEAVREDGLKEAAHCDQNAECWKVAVYVRPLDIPKKQLADFHFVRQDKLPDGTTKWSHKPGDGDATDQKYNPDTEKYDGGPITNPEKDNIGPGYKFCCYVCCCPDVRVALLRRREELDRDYVGIVPGDSFGQIAYRSSDETPGQILEAVEEARSNAGVPWTPGEGPGALLCRIDFADPETGALAFLNISTEAVSLFRGSPIFFPDPSRSTIARLRISDWFLADRS